MKFQFPSGSRPLDGFTIKRGIGRGGFGEVYFALSDAGKEVALKRVERNVEIELRGVSQCLNLKHPNLVSLFDIRRDAQDQTWIVMEYVAGDNLRQSLDQHSQGFAPEQVLSWMRGILAGVGYLHDQGIVHRDLKPGNIFEDYGAIKIGDYGLSKSLSVSRRSGQTESIGTAHYMAPEIGRGTYGKSIDLYACGVMLYEMLTGHLPFDGESSQEILMKHLTQEPDLAPVPAPFRQVVSNSLQKDPQLRISNAKEFLQQLAQVEAGKPVAEPPVVAEVVTPTPAKTAIPVAKFHTTVPHPPVSFPMPETSGTGDGRKTLTIGLVAALLVFPAMLLVIGFLRAGFSFTASSSVMPGTDVLSMLPGVRSGRMPDGIGVFAIMAMGGIGFALAMGIRMLLGNKPAVVPASGGTPQLGTPANPLPHGHWPGQVQGSFQMPEAHHGQSWEEYLRSMLIQRSYAERAEEWAGSLLISALVVGVVHLLVWMARSEIVMLGHSQPITVLAWSFCVSTLGAWTLLTINKFQEGQVLDPFRRRGEHLLAGLVVGLLAIALSRFLLIDFPVPSSGGTTQLVWQEFFQPGALGRVMVTIAAVFATLSWWKHCDPVRESRVSVGKLFLVLLATWVWSMLLSTNEAMIFLALASMSLSIQFASPWIPTQRRQQIRRALQESRGYRR